ncbi:hypothetical protein BDR04DRAFT_1141053 [Suillus decipiens]|nr:hypothetical protein BDR04DRAFT_1141053 [Suillus decipiens]
MYATEDRLSQDHSNSTKAPGLTTTDRSSSATAGSSETLCPMRYSGAFMDPAPNLIAVYIVDDEALLDQFCQGYDENRDAAMREKLKGFRGSVLRKYRVLSHIKSHKPYTMRFVLAIFAALVISAMPTDVAGALSDSPAWDTSANICSMAVGTDAKISAELA